MTPSPDIVKKTALVLIIMVLLGVVWYFLKMQTPMGPQPASVSLLDKVQEKRVVRTIKLTDVAPEQKRYTSAQDATRALIECKRRNLAIADCVRFQNQKYEVVAAVPRKMAADGFEGFIMFPLRGDTHILMDYNRLQKRQQFLYYGSFERLQDQVDAGGMSGPINDHVKSVRDIIK